MEGREGDKEKKKGNKKERNAGGKEREREKEKKKKFKKRERKGQGRWLSWLEYHSVYQKVAGSVIGQGTYLDCESNIWSGLVWKAMY